MFDSYNCLYWQITQRMKNVLRRVCYLVSAQRGFFHIMWSLILPQMFLSRSKTDSLMAHCSVKMINDVNQNEWYLKKIKWKNRWKPHRPKLIISWCAAALKLVLQVKLRMNVEAKTSARMRTVWLSTWLLLRCQPFLKHSQTFCFHCLSLSWSHHSCQS